MLPPPHLDVLMSVCLPLQPIVLMSLTVLMRVLLRLLAIGGLSVPVRLLLLPLLRLAPPLLLRVANA